MSQQIQKVIWSRYEEVARAKKIPPLQAWLWGWRNYEMIEDCPYERWEFMRNACLILIPALAKGDYNPWFETCCRVYAKSSYIAAMGCGNSGKTWSFHTLAFVDYMSDPHHTQGIFTTTSQDGLERRMWPILSSHYRSVRPAGWKITNNPRKTIMANRDDPKHTLRAVAIEERANKNMITDNIIGAHSDRIIWIVDEATSAPDAIFDAWKNLAGGTTHRRFVLLGNPIDQMDTLGSFCRPTEGWDKLGIDTDQWNFNFQGEIGTGVHFNGEKSPNLNYPKKPNGSSRWSFLFGHFDIERHKSDSDKDPLGYARFCQGWFADSSIVPKVMTMAHLDQGGVTKDCTFYGSTKTFAALDPAYGGDRPAFKIFKMGIDAESMVNVMKQIGNYTIPLRPGKLVGQEIGEFVIQKAKEFGFKIVGIDTTTDNSAPAEYIRLNSDLQVLDVNFGGRPSDLPVSPSDATLCSDKYVNKVTELWFTIRYVLHQIRGLDKETCFELCSRYFDRTGKPEKMVVEPKRKMKERTRGKSPDCFVAGTLVLTKNGKVPIENIREGDLVRTPYGFSPVTFTHKVQYNEIATVEFSNGSTLTGTPNHKIFTWSEGWKRMDALVIANEIESDRMIPLWNILNLLSIREKNFGFKLLVDIISQGGTVKMRRKDFYIGGFGLRISDLFQRAKRSIIKTEIGWTIQSKISNLVPRLTTCGYICSSDMKTNLSLKRTKSILRKHRRPLRSGIHQMMEKSGTVSTHFNLSGKPELIKTSNASFAEIFLKLFTKKLLDFVPTVVCKKLLEREIAPRENALFAKLLSFVGSMTLQKLVVVNVRLSKVIKPETVYNLTLAEDNVYYANGVLVQNCADTLAIAVQVFRHLGGFEIEGAFNSQKDWKELAKRKGQLYSSEHAYTT